MATTLEELRGALIELDEQLTLDLTHRLLDQGRVAPMSILNACQQALKVVGERYERQEYFISGLIMAGELFKEVLDLAQLRSRKLVRRMYANGLLQGYSLVERDDGVAPDREAA